MISRLSRPSLFFNKHLRPPRSHALDIWLNGLNQAWVRRLGVLGVILCSISTVAWGQISDNPSDATPSLTFNTTAGLSNTLTTACTTGSLNPASGDFSLSSTPTSTPVTIAGPAPCGNFMDLPPAAPNAAHDAWFRIDVPATAHRFRVTLIPGTVSPMTNGAMAIYEAPSASGPFRLIECAFGGSSITGSSTQPTLEAGCITAGNKLYVRVWDEATRASTLNFKLCVQGQEVATMPSRGAEETPCAATLLNPSASTYSIIDYAYTCDETPWLFADSGQYIGGDLWLRLTVPASGTVGMFIYRAATQFTNNIAVTAYLASACGTPATYRQVGHFGGSLAATPPATPNLTVSCLTPGATLYLRIHSFRDAQFSTLRYGKFRIRWTAGPATPAPPSNNQPCGATALTFGGSCPSVSGPGGNFDACNTPGIPIPPCGTFDGNTRDVWYSFVAPPSGTVHIEATSTTSGFPADPAMALYTTGGNGCNGRFTLIQCDANSGVGYSARIFRSGLVPGHTYYVRAWAEGSSAQGTYSICITEPSVAAGSCLYMISLSVLWGGGTQFMDVTINGGTPTTYATNGEPNEVFLVSIPNGATVLFEYYNTGTSTAATRQVYRLGDPVPLWSTTSGGPVAGPTPPPEYTFTLTNACGPIATSLADCLGAETVCTPNTEFGNLFGSIPPGNSYDLTAANMGCLNVENKGIAWLIFRPITDGTVAFWFDGTTNAPTTDLDFAIWDTGPAVFTPSLPNVWGGICAPETPPVRCSSARRNQSTGLQIGMDGLFTEGPGGWGWLAPLPVLQDHIYLIALVRGAGTVPNVQYQMRWTLHTDASGNTSNSMLSCTPMILPVELLFLEAKPEASAVQLNWATGSEKDSDHFIVERSSDGLSHFQPIGAVDAVGNSLRRTDYGFRDEQPEQGVNYYRLRQVDSDGTTTLSNVVTAEFSRTADRISMFPNPVNDQLYISLSGSEENHTLQLRIIDATGRVVQTNHLVDAGRNLRMEVSGLAPGPYVLVISDDHQVLVGSSTFMKE